MQAFLGLCQVMNQQISIPNVQPHPQTCQNIQNILKFGRCQTLTCNLHPTDLLGCQHHWLCGLGGPRPTGPWEFFPRDAPRMSKVNDIYGISIYIYIIYLYHISVCVCVGGSSARSREFWCPWGARNLDGGSIGKELRKRQLQ